MSKEQHVSTPWTLGGSAAWSEAAKDRGPVFVCDMHEGTHVPVGTNQANARFIVRAVNSHQALIDALRPFANTPIHHFQQGHSGIASDCPECGPVLRAINALALAEKDLSQ